jgi:hypothetical protein
MGTTGRERVTTTPVLAALAARSMEALTLGISWVEVGSTKPPLILVVPVPTSYCSSIAG